MNRRGVGATWGLSGGLLLAGVLIGMLGCGRPDAASVLKDSTGNPVGLLPPEQPVIVDSVEFGNFILPQVQLADTAVMRRINENLVWQMLGEFYTPDGDTLDLKQDPRALLHQAWTSCCTDSTTGEYRPGQGRTGTDYEVLYNDGRLLSFAFNLETTGAYSWNAIRHAVFDVRTGEQIIIEEIVTDTTQLQQRLRDSINVRTAATLADVLEMEEGDTALVNDLARWFHWNPVTHRVDFTRMGESELPYIDDFVVTAEGIVVFNAPYVPRPIANFTPESAYVFPFTSVRLQPAWHYLLTLPPSSANEPE